MCRLLSILPVLLLPIAVAAAQAPAPDPLEPLLWQGAVKANTVDAYDTYLHRYPAGPHAAEARVDIARLGGAPAPAAAAPPPAPVAVAAAEPAASPLFLCRPVFAPGAAPLDKAGDEELTAYLAATRANSLDAYRHYLALYPQGLFAPEVKQLVDARAARAAAFAASPVPGPQPARRRTPFVLAPGDYPPSSRALGETGMVVASWDVAEDGCVERCRIEQSSGSATLDATTCRLITLRGRYDPARDAAGKPVRATESSAVSWPPNAPPAR